ncbi:MAG: nicotinate-nucleotide adenylyltransferase [Pseudobdellovibrionaceae bacterium]
MSLTRIKRNSFPLFSKHLPPALTKGRRIGLLGGSFNPAHEGHLHISAAAKHWLKLDEIWWIVTPQNPHKGTTETESTDIRLAKARELTRTLPYIRISAIERETGYNRTHDTLLLLLQAYPKTDFVWIGGYDLASGFHRWQNWRGILDLVPVAFLARPPLKNLVRHAPVSLLSGAQGAQQVLSRPMQVELSPRHIYWVKSMPVCGQSSTALRNRT